MQSEQITGDHVESLSLNVSSSSNASLVKDPLPSLPTMAATRLQLELLRNDSVVDLKNVTEVILSDPGATLQILRVVGEEFPNDEERPKRIEDCIVSLSLARCYQVICAAEISHSNAYVPEWQHCRRLAECARELAKELDGFSPEEAYLVGLLYRIGRFPQLLGWKSGSFLPAESDALGLMLACHWHLPQCVMVAIREHQEIETSPKWKSFLSLAHQLADQCAA